MSAEVISSGDQPQAGDTERTLMLREILAVSALPPPRDSDWSIVGHSAGTVSAINTGGNSYYWQIRGQVQGASAWVTSPVHSASDGQIDLFVGVGAVAQVEMRWGAASAVNNVWSAWSPSQPTT